MKMKILRGSYCVQARKFARYGGMEELLAAVYSPITGRVAIDGSQVKLACLQAG